MDGKNQELFPYSGPTLDALEPAFSRERMATYEAWAGGDRETAYKLYALNVALSEALYCPLQMLEVALRNGFHIALTTAYGEEWFNRGGVITEVFQRHKIRDAQLDLIKDKKPLTPGRVVASLTFGFWTSCLNRRYENTLWRRALHTAFTYGPKDLKMKRVNAALTPIRVLRNRIAHHEPILGWDLKKHHENVLMLTGWLSPAAADWAAHHSRFAKIYPEEGITLASLADTH